MVRLGQQAAALKHMPTHLTTLPPCLQAHHAHLMCTTFAQVPSSSSHVTVTAGKDANNCSCMAPFTTHWKPCRGHFRGSASSACLQGDSVANFAQRHFTVSGIAAHSAVSSGLIAHPAVHNVKSFCFQHSVLNLCSLTVYSSTLQIIFCLHELQGVTSVCFCHACLNTDVVATDQGPWLTRHWAQHGQMPADSYLNGLLQWHVLCSSGCAFFPV